MFDYICIEKILTKCLKEHPSSKIVIIWCLSKADITGMMMADAAEKGASYPPQIIDTSPSPEVVLQRIQKQLLEAAAAPLSKAGTILLMANYKPEDKFKALATLTRPGATAVAQVRARHFPLKTYLFMFKASDSPNCNLCTQRKDVNHLLITCRKFVGLRRRLFNTAKEKKNLTSWTTLLNSPPMFKAVARFV